MVFNQQSSEKRFRCSHTDTKGTLSSAPTTTATFDAKLIALLALHIINLSYFDRSGNNTKNKLAYHHHHEVNLNIWPHIGYCLGTVGPTIIDKIFNCNILQTSSIRAVGEFELICNVASSSITGPPNGLRCAQWLPSNWKSLFNEIVNHREFSSSSSISTLIHARWW